MNTAKLRQRIEWIDAAKGIGILLVVLGHAFRDEMRAQSGICEFVYQAIYFFHMPLFFVISGLTFGLSWRKDSKSPLRFVKKRVQTQLVPVFAYATAIYLCFLAAYQLPAIQQALSTSGYQMYPYLEYLKLTALQNNPYAIHLWYLWILFILSTVTFLCLRWGAKNKRTEICFAAGALILAVLAAFLTLPVLAERLFGYLVYFAAGILLSSRQQLLKKSRIANAAAVLSWVFMLAYCLLCALRYEWRFLNETGLALCKLVANTFIIYSILRLSERLKNCRILLCCGRESYSIYLLHQPFCCGFVGAILYNKLKLPALAVFIVCCVLSIALPAAVVAVCRRIKPIGKLAKHLFHIS